MCKQTVQEDAQLFQFVPERFIFQEMCEQEVQEDAQLFQFARERFQTLGMCEFVVKEKASLFYGCTREVREPGQMCEFAC